MKKIFSDRVERARHTAGPWGSSLGDDYGAFLLRTNNGVLLKVIASSGTEEIPWEHVSVSTQTRCPTWDEMQWVKSLFWEDDEVVVQFHPAKSQYVNFHPFCLHMWRPIGVTLPLPPTEAIGPVVSER